MKKGVALLVAAALSGCGGDEGTEPTASPEAAADDGRVLVAALGDSITAGSPLWDPDPAVRRRIERPDERSQYEHWAARASPGLELRNCGASGERTDEIAARLEDCADGAEALVVQGGINDIAQGRPVEAPAASLLAMVRRGKELGLEVAIADLLPWNRGHPAATPAIEHLNRTIAEIARIEDVPLLPFHDTLEDPRRPGRMSKRLSEDGDHPSVAGYRLLGKRAFEPAARMLGAR